MSLSRNFRPLVTLLCASVVPVAFAQSSSTTTTTTTSPNAATTTTTNPTQAQTAPGAVTTPSAPFSPPPVTQPVPTPVVPPTGAPLQGPVDRSAPATVTQPVGPTAPGTVALPPGSTSASTALDASGQRIAVSGASIDALAAAGVEVAVDPQNALSNLRRADASGQTGVTAELQTRLDATNRALTEARARARATGFPLASAEFDQLAAEVRTREDLLRETLRNAATSNSEAEWRQLQSVLDTQYSAYADAVLRANRLLQPPRG